MVEKRGEDQKKASAPSQESSTKKKRNRTRNRPRNKRNLIAKALEASSAENSVEKSLEENSPIEEKPIDCLIKEPEIKKAEEMKPLDGKAPAPDVSAVKSREQIMAEREAKKLAKQAKKQKDNPETKTSETNASMNTSPKVEAKDLPSKPKETSPPETKKIEAVEPIKSVAIAGEKSREQIKAEREAKKQAKQAAKAGKAIGGSVENVTQDLKNLKVSNQGNPSAQQVPEKKKPELTKAERRAIQEAQRAAKAQAQALQKKPVTNSAAISKTPAVEKATPVACEVKAPQPISPAKVATPKLTDCKVKLFNHLESSKKDVNLFINSATIHPSITRLGEQYAKRTIVGSNARCIAFLNALKMVIQDFETPPKKEFSRSLEVTIKNCVNHLQDCRPLAVSVSNAHKHIKHVLTQLPTDKPESDLKQSLCHFIDTYIENQIGKAAQAISSSLQEKITDGDVLLTFGCSSLIHYIFEEAHKRKVDFRVIVVDSRPFCEGQEMLRRLSAKGIPCTYVLINAAGFVMPEATKVLLGAHALLSNGYVMARTGSAQIALVARSFNVPVLVCCETHKFSERFQTDAIVYNELGNPDDLVIDEKCCLTNWKTKGKLAPLNLNYDITPPELVTAVVTEVSILPCTSVPVILRIKPTEIGY